MTTLATRIPKALHRALRLHCVKRGVMVQDFVEAALRERLAPQSERRDVGKRGSNSRPGSAVRG
jgi:hypothetical protein